MIEKSLLPSESDVRFFEKNGYWLAGKLVDDERLERLREAMDQVYAGQFETGVAPWDGGWKPGDDPAKLRKTNNTHWANATLRQLATDPTLGAIAARLMRTEEVRLWHDQLLYKPGGGQAAATHSGNIGWHQDSHYWQCTVYELITAWVALGDVTQDNGCMQVVPGSHRWGLLDGSDFFNTDLEALKASIEGQSGRKFDLVPCELKAGQVSFHHCLTVHGSGPNRTDSPRRSHVIHLQPSHAYYLGGTASDEHMNVTLLRQLGGNSGDLFRGKHWPVLSPPPGD